jgi:signal transduction histidine kinase
MSGPSNPGFNPKRYAAILATGYFVVTATWIKLSTYIAGSKSISVEELERIETVKGLGFMAFSSIMLFFAAYWVLRRHARYAQMLVTSQQKLVQAEREAVSGLLAASVAHDISNLLTIQRLSLETIKGSPDLSVRAKDSIDRLDRATQRLTDIVTRLRNAGRSIFREAPRNFDAGVAIADTIALMRVHSASRDTTIMFGEPNERLELNGYPVLVHQLVMNLILNAAEATHGRGRILIEVAKTDDGIKICVSDDGPGVPRHSHESIFHAFFTTKPRGSGLGLTSVRSSVDIHGGSIDVGVSKDLGGARFVVQLPHLDESRALELGSVNMSESVANAAVGSDPVTI